MKTISFKIKSFNNTLKSEETKMPEIKKMFQLFISLLFILVITSSCGRNVSSGCGAWPMANKNGVKNLKGESGNTNSYKYNKQFATYKGFN